MNIVVSNLPEHNLRMGMSNISGYENDIKEISWHLERKTLKARQKVDSKTRL